MQPVNFDETLDQIVGRDPRFSREAYVFLREALDVTQRPIARARKSEVCHVSGQQLLEGVRDHARSQFGPMARMVLAEWGVRRCEDFGEIVFNMVENGLLSKTESDSRADFTGGYDFFEVFSKPFLPQAKAHANPEPSGGTPSGSVR